LAADNTRNLDCVLFVLRFNRGRTSFVGPLNYDAFFRILARVSKGTMEPFEFGWTVIKPIRAPDAMKAPAKMLKDILP